MKEPDKLNERKRDLLLLRNDLYKKTHQVNIDIYDINKEILALTKKPIKVIIPERIKKD